jgi:hypothetical protein
VQASRECLVWRIGSRGGWNSSNVSACRDWLGKRQKPTCLACLSLVSSTSYLTFHQRTYLFALYSEQRRAKVQLLPDDGPSRRPSEKDWTCHCSRACFFSGFVKAADPNESLVQRWASASNPYQSDIVVHMGHHLTVTHRRRLLQLNYASYRNPHVSTRFVSSDLVNSD